MPFEPKTWVDAPEGYVQGDAVPDGATPTDAAALNDLEARVEAALLELAGSGGADFSNITDPLEFSNGTDPADIRITRSSPTGDYGLGLDIDKPSDPSGALLHLADNFVFMAADKSDPYSFSNCSIGPSFLEFNDGQGIYTNISATGIRLTAPDLGRWTLSVANDGTLTTSAA